MIPSSIALLNNLPSTFTAMTKSWGDNGSPWRNLLRCQIGGPGSPLSKTFVLTEDSNMASQFRNLSPKPYCRSTSKRNGHDSESKACARSSLSNLANLWRQGEGKEHLQK